MKTSVRWKAAARKTLASLKDKDLLGGATVVLVGSLARDTSGTESDIDLLVVASERPPRLSTGGELQVLRISRSDFIRRLECGDDFPHWAVRYGRLLSDESHWWQELQRNPALEEWPDWRRKLSQAGERLRFVGPLLESSDYEHAQEELLLAVRHLARAILLKEQVFPLSQPELSGQVRRTDHGKIAELLDSLRDEAAPALEEAQRIIQEYVEKLSK